VQWINETKETISYWDESKPSNITKSSHFKETPEKLENHDTSREHLETKVMVKKQKQVGYWGHQKKKKKRRDVCERRKQECHLNFQGRMGPWSMFCEDCHLPGRRAVNEQDDPLSWQHQMKHSSALALQMSAHPLLRCPLMSRRHSRMFTNAWAENTRPHCATIITACRVVSILGAKW
jgi:hypothetical protein